MSGLQIMYSKEVARELTKIAVVLPGAPVEVGQIVHFPFGKRRIWPFRKPAPRGSFNVISTLENLNIQPQISAPDGNGDPYIFSSRNSVKIDVDYGSSGKEGGKSKDIKKDKNNDKINGADRGNINDINIYNEGSTTGKLVASFSAEGAVYFAAIDCKTTRITNLDQIQVDLSKHRNEIVWDDTFLITSVTVAGKALIMQSGSNSASLNLTGNVKGLITGRGSDISVRTSIMIENFRESAFIKPWSDNVTIFIGLHRFTEKKFGFQPKLSKLRVQQWDTDRINQISNEIVQSEFGENWLEPVSALEILDDGNANQMV